MNIQSMFLSNSLTLVFVLGSIIVLVGLIGIILLALKREINSLVSLSLLVIVFGLFLIGVDRLLIKYVDSVLVNRIQIIGVVLLGVLYLLKNWKSKD